MREIHSMSVIVLNNIGITPAYAGNTTIFNTVIYKPQDHPRVCGKYGIQTTPFQYVLGSPPRMREILEKIYSNMDYLRITPAYAGNTLKNPNKIAIFPRLNSKNYLLFKINPLLHTILQNYNLMKETLTILSN